MSIRQSLARALSARRPRPLDVVVALLLFAAAFAIARFGSGWMGDVPLLDDRQDIWLQGDQARVVAQMTSRFSDGGYTFNHPFFPVVAHPPTWAFNRVLGMSERDAARTVTALILGVWALLLFALMRRLRLGVADAALVCVAALASAAFLFWSVTIEVFLFSAVTIVAAFIVASAREDRPVSDGTLVATGVATLGLTVTNWMIALLLTMRTRPWRRTIQIAAYTIAVASVLWAIERRLYENVEYFFDRPAHSYVFLQTPSPARLARVTTAAVLHTAVAPEIRVCNNRPPAVPHYLSMQHAPPFSNGADGAVASVAWLVLLGLGIAALVGGATTATFRAVLLLSAAGQLVLHWVFGGETFLYSMHFLSVLLPVAAVALLGRFQWPARVVLLVFIVSAASANVRELRHAATIFTPASAAAFRNDGTICRR